jgi:hypothetical protein
LHSNKVHGKIYFRPREFLMFKGKLKLEIIYLTFTLLAKGLKQGG